MFTPLVPALPDFASGVLFSSRYDDVYHAAQGAFMQARHVFLGGNGLPARWQGREAFTVLETGFGLGQNFLALWQAWRDDPRRSARLHVVSIEAHPFEREPLQALLRERVPPEARDLARQLHERWPPLLPGLHRIDFEEGAVTLTLAFGLALDVVPQLTARVDAFFLDGFSPDRNPEMWSAPLMKALARLAAPDATAASWTSAGIVRGALQEAGFEVDKRPGFAGKRHTIAARYAPRYLPRHAPPEPCVHAERHAVVVGAGIAGAGVAHALALRGWRVTVLGAAPHASAHRAAAMTPLVARDDNLRARLTRAGALRARERWARWIDGNLVARVGTLQMARSEARQAELHATLAGLGFPREWVRAVDAAEAADLAGVPVARGGAWFADGLLVRPAALCAALLDQPGIAWRHAAVDRIVAGPDGAGWRALANDGSALAAADVLVLANSVDAPRLLARSGWPLSEVAGEREAGRLFFAQERVAGQITCLPAAGGPRCIVAGEGYVLPAVDEKCVTGSTYAHGAETALATAEGHGVNAARAAQLLPGLAGIEASALDGWAGWRAVLPGRLPAIGPVAGGPGLWVAAGYASRGLTWSALAGDLIAAQLEGEPLMLERDLLAAIAWR